MAGLVLVAAGGLAREVLSAIDLIGHYDDVVMVDDDPGLWGTSSAETKVLGGLDLVHALPSHDVLIGAGRGSTRLALATRLLAGGLDDARFASLVHPRASIGSRCRVGAGSILLAHTTLTCDVSVGRHVVIMPGVTLTHDAVAEDYATLCAGVSVGGSARIGSGAYIGMNATVREGVSVGEGSVLGMGAALVEDLPPGETWVGVPAGRLEGRRP